MAIIVDEARFPGKNGTLYAHMMSDLPDRRDEMTELTHAALRIGLLQEWLQDDLRHPHFDLTESKRNMAIKRGAKAVTSVEMVRMYQKRHADREALKAKRERIRGLPEAQSIVAFLKFSEQREVYLSDWESMYEPHSLTHDDDAVTDLLGEWLEAKEGK